MKKIIILLSLFFGLGLSQVQSEFLIRENYQPMDFLNINTTSTGFYISNNVIKFDKYHNPGNTDYNSYGINDRYQQLLHMDSKIPYSYYSLKIDTNKFVYYLYRGNTTSNPMTGITYYRNTYFIINKHNGNVYSYNRTINTKEGGNTKFAIDTFGRLIFKEGNNNIYFDTNDLVCVDSECVTMGDNPDYMKIKTYTENSVLHYINADIRHQKYIIYDNTAIGTLYKNENGLNYKQYFYSINDNSLINQVSDVYNIENEQIDGYNLINYNNNPLLSIKQNDLYKSYKFNTDNNNFEILDNYYYIFINSLTNKGWRINQNIDIKSGLYGNLLIYGIQDSETQSKYYIKNDNNLYTDNIDSNNDIPDIGDGGDNTNNDDFELPNDGNTIIGKLENLMYIISKPIAFTKNQIGGYINEKIIGPIGDYINGPEITYIIDLFTYSSDDFVQENGVTFNFVKPVFTNKLTFDIIPYSYFVEFPTDKYNFSEIERDNSVLFFVGLFHSFIYLLSKFILVSLILAPIFLLLKIVDYVTTLLNVKYNGTGNVIGLGFYIAYLVVLFAIIIAYFALLFSYVSVITLIISYINFIIVFSVGTFGAIQHFNTINIVLTVSLASLLTATILMYVANKYAKLN